MYKEIIVWKKHSGSTIRFVCFKKLDSNEYSVQSCDYFNEPINSQQITEALVRAVELLSESDPGEREGWYQSLPEAIESHMKEFDM